MEFVEEFEISIPSETAAGQKVQERIVAVLEKLDYPPRDVFGMRLALEEALVNAIKHGNQMDPEKQVQVSCWIGEEIVRVEIEDQGEGFSLEDVPDPTDDENLERPCGRGIMLMKAFLNVVEYNECGNKVVLEKQRGIEPPKE
ncbi:MAG: ATP-binding protein [Planctomycetaceae bacterium]